MYKTEEEKKQDIEGMYKLLLKNGEIKPIVLNIVGRMVSSDSKDKYLQVWNVYLDLMYRVGGDIFTDRIQWKLASEKELNQSISLIFSDGYEKCISELISGVRMLFAVIDKDRNKKHIFGIDKTAIRLESIKSKFDELTNSYRNAGIITNPHYGLMMEYIERIEHLYSLTMSIIEKEIENYK